MAALGNALSNRTWTDSIVVPPADEARQWKILENASSSTVPSSHLRIVTSDSGSDTVHVTETGPSTYQPSRPRFPPLTLATTLGGVVSITGTAGSVTAGSSAPTDGDAIATAPHTNVAPINNLRMEVLPRLSTSSTDPIVRHDRLSLTPQAWTSGTSPRGPDGAVDNRQGVRAQTDSSAWTPLRHAQAAASTRPRTPSLR